MQHAVADPGLVGLLVVPMPMLMLMLQTLLMVQLLALPRLLGLHHGMLPSRLPLVRALFLFFFLL